MGTFEDHIQLEGAFDGCWPVSYEGALPRATNERGVWWSHRDGAWMSKEEIVSRGKVADTYTTDGPEACDESAANDAPATSGE